MGSIHVETPSIRKYFIQHPVIVGTRAFALPLRFVPAQIEQWIFIFIVP